MVGGGQRTPGQGMKRHILGWSGFAGLVLTVLLALTGIGQTSAHLATHWCPCMAEMLRYLATVAVAHALIAGAGVASVYVWVAYWKDTLSCE